MSITHSNYLRNLEGRDFIVSDLHGVYDLFLEKLKEIDFDKKIDRMFCVGDLIDRGPKSYECLKLIYEPWFHTCRGNHEQFLIDVVLEGDDPYWWYRNGGIWREHIGTTDLISITKYFRGTVPMSMTLETEYGKIGICHAEVPSEDWNDVKSLSENLSDEQKKNMIWGRSLVKAFAYTGTKNIDLTIHGHSIIKEPKMVGNAFFIDTGAFHTGVLTVLRIDDILK